MKIFVINCQSVANKKEDLAEMSTRTKADIIIAQSRGLSQTFCPRNFFHQISKFSERTEL